MSARARIAGLAGGVTVFAVLVAVLPFLLQGALESRQTGGERLRAVLAAGAAVQPAQLETVRTESGLDGLVLLNESGAELVGTPREALQTLASGCPEAVGSRAVDLAPVQISEGTLIGACVAQPSGARLVAGLVLPSWSSSGRSRQILVMALVFGLLAGGLSMATVRTLLRPLDEMAEAARALAAGQSVRVAVPAEAELQPVAEALNQLATAQKIREDEIELRLALTKELAAVVAHEVRNPLQSLTMLADVVAHEPEEARRRELLASIQQELVLIEEVVRRLVDSGDELQLLLRPVELDQLSERCARLLAPLAREGGVELSVEAAPGQALADGPLLRRAVENLVHNAVVLLAGAGGGRVELRVLRLEEAWAIRVDDDGSGVPESERERIFQAGVTGREGGSGLGLALARRVAAAHGGSLRVTDSPLGGARFELTLPLPAETA